MSDTKMTYSWTDSKGNPHNRERVVDKNSEEVRPTIVCLCGSTRFYRQFQEANYRETMDGKIVLSVGFFMHASEEAHGETWGCTPEQKIALDRLHFRKIDLADEVLILNVGGYVGNSTANELAYAKSLGKTVRYLEAPKNSPIEQLPNLPGVQYGETYGNDI